MRQHTLHRPAEADRQIMLGGQRFRGGQRAGGGIKQDGVGIGAAGVEAKKNRHGDAFPSAAVIARRYISVRPAAVVARKAKTVKLSGGIAAVFPQQSCVGNDLMAAACTIMVKGV